MDLINAVNRFTHTHTPEAALILKAAYTEIATLNILNSAVKTFMHNNFASLANV